MTLQELSTRWSCHPNTLYHWLREKHVIQYEKQDHNRIAIPKSEVARYEIGFPPLYDRCFSKEALQITGLTLYQLVICSKANLIPRHKLMGRYVYSKKFLRKML